MKHNFTGLTNEEVRESRNKFGNNELTPQKVESFWDKLLENFKDPIIIILLVALVIIFVLSLFGLTEWYEALAIGIAVALATFVSTLSEFKNETSFQKLQEEASRIKNNVIRNGEAVEIPVSDIVVGEHVLLQSGDKIPADGIILKGDLKVNQASLTGESHNVVKLEAPENYVTEQKDLNSKYDLFRGSVVDDGEAIMLVETIGDHTFYGNLAKELSLGQERLSPLQVKLKGLAKLISRFGYIAAIVIAVVFTFNKVFIQNNFDAEQISAYVSHLDVLIPDLMHIMVLAIIIVVAAIPEGLPMMIAIVLSLNMRKLLVEKVLVRRLLGIETAGSLNILFSDKTGTITKGKLEPRVFVSSTKNNYPDYSSIPEPLKTLTCLSIIENSSSFISSDGEVIGGNVSERALIAFIDKNELPRCSSLGVEQEKNILFNSIRKFSASQIKVENKIKGIDTDRVTLMKGAPEVILSQCNKYFDEDCNKLPFDGMLDNLTEELDRLADSGIRLIALAISEELIKDDESIPNQATLVGVIGIGDEIREESRFAIDEVRKAGIQVVMITGDRKGTAAAIAQEAGLLTGEDDVIMVSSELNNYTDEELKKILPNLKIIARALPTDKSRLVRVSKSLGKVVGMTGDGVNDSAALKQADVGVAMGSGSEVSKEAGDIVILDDNFHSISNAIRYGRTIFKSIRKFIIFQLTVNVAAVTTVFLGPLMGIDFPLTIIQLLWINIIMDTLAAIAFGGEPALKRYMKDPPINREENILTKDMISSILTSGLYISLFSLFFLSYDPFQEWFVRDGVLDESVHLTVFFNIFIFMIMLNGFNVRTHLTNLMDNLGKNKKFIYVMAFILGLQVIFTYIGGEILRTTPLNLTEWFIVFIFSITIIPVDLLRKTIIQRFSSRQETVSLPGERELELEASVVDNKVPVVDEKEEAGKYPVK